MPRAKRLRRVCGVMAALFLCVAAGRLIAAASPAVDPAFVTTGFFCQPWRCWSQADPVRLLAAEEREAVAHDPARQRALTALLVTPRTRATLAAAEAVRGLPAAFLFLALALGLRRLAAGGIAGGAVPWLRRAAAAALATVVAQPFADTLRATALSPITTGRQQLYIAFNGGPFFWGLLLAGGVWIFVWALDEAREAEGELAAIV
jgi:hypothetical protein